MLEKIETKIETKLSSITEVKLIDWFNDQYSGTLHTVPAIFIEFPDSLVWKTLRGTFQSSNINVRIHLASKILPDLSGKLSKTLISEHEEIVDKIFYAISGYNDNYDSGEKLFESLRRTALERIQYLKGWFITTQDFHTTIYQRSEAAIEAIIEQLEGNVNL